MDENFGGQPNPLNPRPNVGPNPVNSQNPTMSSSTGQNINQVFTNAPRPMQPTTGANFNRPQNVNPIRPMEKAPEATPEPPKKKKKTGLVVGIIILILLLIGVAVAAFFMLNKSDPVSKAVEKIISGQAPENIALDGAIEIESNSEDIGALSAVINLKSQGSVNSLINTTSAEVELNFKDLGSVTLTADELYPSNGDLYLKVSGISTALKDYDGLMEEYYNTVYSTGNVVLDEVIDESAEAIGESVSTEIEANIGNNSVITGISSALEVFGNTLNELDGKWIKISLDEFTELTSNSVDNTTDCSANLVSDIKNSGNTLIQLYSENSFISSTTENVTLTSKNSKVYKVVLDNEKLNNFISKVNQTNFINNYKNCTQSNDSIFETMDTSNLPDFYVELDNEYNFTRVYTSTTINENSDKLTADVSLSYPKDINVSQPENAVDFVEVIQKLFNGLNITESDLVDATE